MQRRGVRVRARETFEEDTGASGRVRLTDGVQLSGCHFGGFGGKSKDVLWSEHGRNVFVLALTVVPFDSLCYGLRTVVTAK